MKKLGLFCVLLLVSSFSLAAPTWQVGDFTAVYDAKVGIARGQTKLKLSRLEGDRFAVESWTELKGLISIFKRGTIYEYSEFDYLDGILLTRVFERRDDISSEDRNVRVAYDWVNKTAAVTYQGDNSSVAIEPGVSNTLVMQVALMQALSTDEHKPWYDVVGHKGRLRFNVNYEGEEDGLYRYSHSREASGIRTTFWAAPKRAHLPLRARIVKDDKVKGMLSLVESPIAAVRTSD